jgi:L-amino acid N-acyltransferase YncA
LSWIPIRSVRRACERDLLALDALCADGSKQVSLWSGRRFDVATWLSVRAPVVAVNEGTDLVAFAAAVADNAPIGAAKCSEVIAYVKPTHRRRGAARAAITELITLARMSRLWKLMAYVGADDPAGRVMLDRVDFREVGVLVKHVQVHGVWRDVVMYERLVLASRKSAPSIGEAQ